MRQTSSALKREPKLHDGFLSKSEQDAYYEFLRKNVEEARASIRRGEGIPGEEVEAYFAAKRAALLKKINDKGN